MSRILKFGDNGGDCTVLDEANTSRLCVFLFPRCALHANVFSRTRLACKGFAKTKRRRPTGQQPGTEGGRGPPLINWLPTARQPPVVFPASVCIRCPLIVHPGTIQDGFFRPWK